MDKKGCENKTDPTDKPDPNADYKRDKANIDGFWSWLLFQMKWGFDY